MSRAEGMARVQRAGAVARARGPAGPRRSRALDQQVRALIASKKRETTDVSRPQNLVGTTVLQCLTSSTNGATAASGTGLLDMDGDECLINSVRLRGVLTNAATLDLDPVGNADVIVRKLVVWFRKPLLVPSAAGTLPPITEVLVADTIESLPVTDAANGGRFVILSDRRWNLGTNTYQAATAVGHARVQGKTVQHYDYTVKVGKKTKFKATAQSGTPAGHYDSDVSAGQVDAGLLVMYVQSVTTGGQIGTNLESTRLNYTG